MLLVLWSHVDLDSEGMAKPHDVLFVQELLGMWNWSTLQAGHLLLCPAPPLELLRLGLIQGLACQLVKGISPPHPPDPFPPPHCQGIYKVPPALPTTLFPLQPSCPLVASPRCIGVLRVCSLPAQASLALPQDLHAPAGEETSLQWEHSSSRGQTWPGPPALQ